MFGENNLKLLCCNQALRESSARVSRGGNHRRPITLFMFRENSIILFGGILLVLLIACARPKSASDAIAPWDKIRFDLSQLNEEGLYGPPDGLRSISYEFCIPADEKLVDEVSSIDTSLRIHPDSPGRIGCSPEEYLCVGNTHQKNYREVLFELARLEYVEKIEQSFFEY